MPEPDHAEGMTLDEVLPVLSALTAAGCRFWLEGGWGVDALVGRQTRAHRDVDVDIDAACEEAALAVLARLGCTVEIDWRSNRVELAAPGRGWVDLHPLLIEEDGSARQAALGGGFRDSPAPSSPSGPWTACLCRASRRRLSACAAPGTSRTRSTRTISLSSTLWERATHATKTRRGIRVRDTTGPAADGPGTSP